MVDGLEIRRSPVDMVNIPLFTGFYTSQVVSRISSINSISTKAGNSYWVPLAERWHSGSSRLFSTAPGSHGPLYLYKLHEQTP